MQTRPDIAWAVNQCAQMSANPARADEMWERMTRVVTFLKSTRDQRTYSRNTRASSSRIVYTDVDDNHPSVPTLVHERAHSTSALTVGGLHT